MNEKSYQEQMDILVNNFNAELGRKVAGRTIGEIGIEELEQLNQDYAALKELNDGLVNEARNRTDIVDTNVVRDLLNSWDTLNAENNVNVPSITKAIMIKNHLVQEKTDEIDRINKTRDLLNAQIREITTAITQNTYTLRTTPFELIAAESENIIKNLNAALAGLNNSVETCNARIATLNSEIEILHKGGFLEEADTLIRSTANMSVENTEAYLNRRAERKDLSGLEAADRKADAVEAVTATKDVTVDAAHDVDTSDSTGATDESADKDKEDSADKAMPEVPTGEGDEAGTTGEEESEKEEAPAEPEKPAETEGSESAVAEEDEEEDISIPDYVPEGGTPGEAVEPEAEPVVEATPAPAEPEAASTTPPAGTPAAPEAAPVVEPTRRRIYAETIAEHIEAHGLPGNLTEAKYLEICNALGIPATDLNYKLNSEELIRLRSDREIDIARRNESLFSKQQRRLKEYDKLIAKYEALLNDKVTEDKFDPTYIAQVQALLENLKRSRNDLENENAKFNTNAHVEHVAGELDPVSREKGLLHKRANEADELNKQIRSEYETYEKQKARRDSMESTKMKKREQKM